MKLWSWLFFGLSGMSFGLDLYHHELKSYPRGAGCQQTAQNLAERLHLVSGAEIYWTGFTKETETVCDIKISYLAAQPIAFSQNSDSIAFGAINQGIKAKMEDCQLELQREEKLFRQFTGIEPWISYCYKGDSFLDPMPYFAFVEGIGKGTLQFFSSEAIVG
ncbi:MAG: hypothetical protein ACKOA8_12445, partial [Deltaproteobacteria bacterium]